LGHVKRRLILGKVDAACATLANLGIGLAVWADQNRNISFATLEHVIETVSELYKVVWPWIRRKNPEKFVFANQFIGRGKFDKTLLFDGWSIGGLFWLVKKYFASILHRKAGAGDATG